MRNPHDYFRSSSRDFGETTNLNRFLQFLSSDLAFSPCRGESKRKEQMGGETARRLAGSAPQVTGGKNGISLGDHLDHVRGTRRRRIGELGVAFDVPDGQSDGRRRDLRGAGGGNFFGGGSVRVK